MAVPYGRGAITHLTMKRPETYFLNSLPENLIVEQVHKPPVGGITEPSVPEGARGCISAPSILAYPRW
jgi:hypothetical protein